MAQNLTLLQVLQQKHFFTMNFSTFSYYSSKKNSKPYNKTKTQLGAKDEGFLRGHATDEENNIGIYSLKSGKSGIVTLKKHGSFASVLETENKTGKFYLFFSLEAVKEGINTICIMQEYDGKDETKDDIKIGECLLHLEVVVQKTFK